MAANPSRPPAKRRPELHRDMLSFHIARHGKRARHFFIYRVIGSRFVDVGRLLHDSMDIERHLPDDYETAE